MMSSRYGDKQSPFYRPSFKPLTPFDLTPYGIQVSGWLIVWCILLAPLFLTDGEGWRKWLNYFKRETREARLRRGNSAAQTGKAGRGSRIGHAS